MSCELIAMKLDDISKEELSSGITDLFIVSQLTRLKAGETSLGVNKNLY